jgi:hypothetical protein
MLGIYACIYTHEVHVKTETSLRLLRLDRSIFGFNIPEMRNEKEWENT